MIRQFLTFKCKGTVKDSLTPVNVEVVHTHTNTRLLINNKDASNLFVLVNFPMTLTDNDYKLYGL